MRSTGVVRSDAPKARLRAAVRFPPHVHACNAFAGGDPPIPLRDPHRAAWWTAETMTARSKTTIVTGATQGLGRAIARTLTTLPDQHVVLAVRDVGRGAEVARELGGRAEVRRLDCASLTDVRRFVAEWQGPLHGLVNNAGVQQVAGTRLSADGFEETIAVNHVAATALTVGLLPRLEGGRVVFIGSDSITRPKVSGSRLSMKCIRTPSRAARPGTL